MNQSEDNQQVHKTAPMCECVLSREEMALGGTYVDVFGIARDALGDWYRSTPNGEMMPIVVDDVPESMRKLLLDSMSELLARSRAAEGR